MAQQQFYRTVMSIEDIQRYYPSILDGIIVNAEDQQYGQQQVILQQTDQSQDIIVSDGSVQQQLVVDGGNLQYPSQQYIIRHEPLPPAAPPLPLEEYPHPPPPPPPPPPPQPMHQHQVYYTSDLPVDAQVVLQQAQQIIDASMMHQNQPHQPQHLIGPTHVMQQPTVIHPQPPPPQPPPPPPPPPQPPPQPSPSHTPQPQQQQMPHPPQSPQLMQHMQQTQHHPQQQTQHHTQQHMQMQQQQLQQQQLQQQQQQMQQQMHQQQQLQQQQQQLQQQQIQQQQIQQQQMQQQQQQQVVMHATYINPNNLGQNTVRAPIIGQRILNQALSGSPGVAVVRAQRAARPRVCRTAARAPRPGTPQQHMQQRMLSPQHIMQTQQASQQQQQQQQAPRIIASPSPRPVVATVPRGAQVRPVRQVTPHILNSEATQAQQRTPRPQRSMLQRPQHPHMSQQMIQQQSSQQNQQQMMHQQQMMQHHQQMQQIKLTPQQQQALQNQQRLVVNQQGVQQSRVLTQQGTIAHQNIQQNMIHQVNAPQQSNSPQQAQTTQPTSQQAAASQANAPQQQILAHLVTQPAMAKKVIVQNNELDDLEESITAAVLQKNPPCNSPGPQYKPSQPSQVHMRAPQQQMVRQSPNHQSPNMYSYGSPHANMQHQMSYDQYGQSSQSDFESDSADDDNQVLTLQNGQRMTMAEYKRVYQIPRQNQVGRGGGRQTLMSRKETAVRPVQRVAPLLVSSEAGEQSGASVSGAGQPAAAATEGAAETQSAKMLIFLQNGEQRLITFTLPKESCTLQEVLEQVNVPFSDDTRIQCMQNVNTEIDYFVSIGSSIRIEDMVHNHPMLQNENHAANQMVQSTSEMSTPEKVPCSGSSESPASSPRPSSPPPRFVEGMLALCKPCGYTGFDFNRCQRCKRIFTEEPKGVPIPKKVEIKKKESEKMVPVKTTPEIKLNLLKVVKATPEKKQRIRKPRGKQPDPEPVILTLSSDEEDSNSSMANSQNESTVCTKEPSDFDLEASDSGLGMDGLDDGFREEISENCEGLFCSLKCKTIRIGSYKYVPKERVYLSSKGIKIVAPSLKDESKEIALQIQTREVVKLLVHYSKSLPVIFLYTLNSCGVYIRKSLDMTDESGPGYYHPASKEDPYKRITLLPELITEEVKMVLKGLFSEKVLDELNTKEANEILVKTCPKELVDATKAITRSMAAQNSQTQKNVNTEIRQILIYPPGKGGISINTEDFMSLGRDMFLNDVIIDFYLKHLVHDVLTPQQNAKTHIFSTFFYKRLTTKPSKVNRTTNPHEWDSSLTPAQKRHARVKKWTKNVNIFEKDFIVVPINENAHWFVAIICFPSLEGCRSMIDNRKVSPQEIKKRDRKAVQIGNTTITPLTKQEQLTLNCDGDNSERDEAEAEESDLDMQCDSDEEDGEKPAEKKIEINSRIPMQNEPIKQPCILIFDSLAGASRSRVVATLRDYLTCEYHAKVSTEKKFTKDNIKGVCPKIPQQNNFTDCGLYLLQYVEQFFKDPIVDYAIPIKQLVSWFEEIVVTRKREEIADLLKKLMVAYSGESPECLPEIAFPTLNGKVVEEEEGDNGENCKTAAKETSPEIANNPGAPVATLVSVKQLPSGEIIKRNILELGVADHVRKTIRLSADSENRSLVQLKPDFIKKSDSEGQIYIPINMHSEFVKEVQNSLINNKKISDKRHLTNNQSVSNANCIRSCDNSSDSDANMTYLKSRRMGGKIEEHEPNKKFKKNEC